MDSAHLERFAGIGRLYGRAGMERLAGASFLVVGLGGVGSWTAEALTRSGVGHLALVDGDTDVEGDVERETDGDGVPDGVTPNPYAGRLYFDGLAGYSQGWNKSDEWRAALSYELDLKDRWRNRLGRLLGRHRLAGIVSAMRRALGRAHLEPADIDYINAHGPGTPVGDRIESRAIRRFFGEHADALMVSSTKSMHGHTLGAAGAIESLICILAMRDSVMPPTINLENQETDSRINHVPNVAQERELNYVLNNSFGFGGHNVSLIMKKHSN